MNLPHRHNRFSQIGWAIVLVLIWGVLTVNRAAAHAYLVRSDPPANTILDAAPATMRLWFSESITAEFSSATLLDTEGQSVELALSIDDTDHTQLIVPLPDLEAGVYSLRWAVHSAADGHITQGLVVFGVGQGADLGTATAVAPETAVSWPEILLRWLTFTLYAGLIGAFAITYLVLDPASQPADIARVQQAAQKRMLRLAWWCSVLGILVGFVWAGWQAVSLTGSSPGISEVTAVAWQWLTQTRLGYFWWARQTILLVLALLLAALARRLAENAKPAGLIRPTGLMLLILLVIQSSTSHAAALTPHTILAVALDTLHVLAASFWVGGLMALVIGLLPLVRHRTDFTALVEAGWRPFGRWAALSVGVLVATGIYSAGREISSANALVTTFYGQTLLLKISLMLVVGLIGATNAATLHPRLAKIAARGLRRPEGWTPISPHRLPILFIAEVCVGLMVLLLVGVLTAAPTARGSTSTITAGASSDLSQTVDDMIIKFSANPNQAGQNLFTVRAVSLRRPPPAEILRVILRFTYLDEDFGLVSADMAQIEPDLYVLSGNQLYVAGAWQIDVVVRRQGIEDSVARFNWIVPSSQAQSDAPPIVSDTPWEGWLTGVAAVLLLGLVVGTAVLWRASHVPQQSSDLTPPS